MTTQTNEIWKDIKGYEGLYQVSNLGNVRSLDRYVFKARAGMCMQRGKLKSVSLRKDGYFDVCLYKNNKPEYLLIHRLVAQAFIPNPENKPTVNHKDGNKQNNSTDNLEWATHQEQSDHAIATGLRDVSSIPKPSRYAVSRAIEANNKQVIDITTGIKYSSLVNCSKILNISVSSIQDSIYHKVYTTSGRLFEFVDAKDKKDAHSKFIQQINSKNLFVYKCIETDEIFLSIPELARKFNLDGFSVHNKFRFRSANHIIHYGCYSFIKLHNDLLLSD